ncbi:hypothetical protein Bbelb_038890 [Branchiostoma belcheri]|nr:hypothetical protein Bbelb_038890 [Branchiostoma belcheri]
MATRGPKQQENQSCRNNILFDRVPDNKQENWSQCEQKVRDILKDKLKLALLKIEIERSHRNGKFQEDGRPRPIVVKLLRYKDKEWRRVAQWTECSALNKEPRVRFRVGTQGHVRTCAPTLCPWERHFTQGQVSNGSCQLADESSARRAGVVKADPERNQVIRQLAASIPTGTSTSPLMWMRWGRRMPKCVDLRFATCYPP